MAACSSVWYRPETGVKWNKRKSSKKEPVFPRILSATGKESGIKYRIITMTNSALSNKQVVREYRSRLLKIFLELTAVT